MKLKTIEVAALKALKEYKEVKLSSQPIGMEDLRFKQEWKLKKAVRVFVRKKRVEEYSEEESLTNNLTMNLTTTLVIIIVTMYL